MHYHIEHPIFFKKHQSIWRAGLSLGLTLCALTINVGANNTALSLVTASIGILLLLKSYLGGKHRISPVLIWTTFLISTLILASFFLKSDLSQLTKIASRIFCGLIWVLWLGTQIDWTMLCQLLIVMRFPKQVISTLDHAIMHGIMTKQEWVSRRNSARIRIGSANLPLLSWMRILSEGSLQAFLRLEHVEENASMRSKTSTDSNQQGTIIIDSVDVNRNERLVLKELCLQLKIGEWLIVCGPSGAGKSTLLRLIAGLEVPIKGTMTRLGSLITPTTALDKRLDGHIALLVQNPEHHFIASTVGEDISWGLLHRGVEVSQAETQSFQMAKSLGIDHLWKQPCHNLSFGEQRRVALAGLLVLKPKILLLDEPTAGLDPVAAHTLRLLVRQLVEKIGATCIWATHDLHSWPKPANRIVLLRNRHIIFDGPIIEGLSKSWLIKGGLAIPNEEEESC